MVVGETAVVVALEVVLVGGWHHVVPILDFGFDSEAWKRHAYPWLVVACAVGLG